MRKSLKDSNTNENSKQVTKERERESVLSSSPQKVQQLIVCLSNDPPLKSLWPNSLSDLRRNLYQICCQRTLRDAELTRVRDGDAEALAHAALPTLLQRQVRALLCEGDALLDFWVDTFYHGLPAPIYAERCFQQSPNMVRGKRSQKGSTFQRQVPRFAIFGAIFGRWRVPTILKHNVWLFRPLFRSSKARMTFPTHSKNTFWNSHSKACRLGS